ncbi:MAG: DUF6713 family protein [Lachnospiraceae bacterium]
MKWTQFRKKEWKMFIVLKDMEDEKAYRTFMLLHIPLYMAILFLLLSDYMRIGLYITDIFLVLHMFVHLGFRNHKANDLNGRVSKTIIYSSGLLAVLHLIAITI